MYSDNDDFGKLRGYDDFNSFSEANEIPSLNALERIRTQANIMVNMAYHNLPDDSTNANHTGFLEEMEIIIIERILDNARARDQRDWFVPTVALLTRQEKYDLAFLGGKRKVFKVVDLT